MKTDEYGYYVASDAPAVVEGREPGVLKQMKRIGEHIGMISKAIGMLEERLSFGRTIGLEVTGTSMLRRSMPMGITRGQLMVWLSVQPRATSCNPS